MGGEGSGRKPDVTNAVLRQAVIARTGNGNVSAETFFLPNMSGVKKSDNSLKGWSTLVELNRSTLAEGGLQHGGVTMTDDFGFVAIRNGTVTGLSASINISAFTSGTFMTFEVRIANGATLGSFTIDNITGTGVWTGYTTFPIGQIPFSTNDAIWVFTDTDLSATGTIIATMELTFQ